MGYQEVRDRRTGLVCWRSSGPGNLRILPDVNADLMFWRGGLHIAGYDTTAHDFDRGPGEITYSIRLPAGVLPYLLHDSASAATDTRVPIPLHPGDSGVARLTEGLFAADEPHQVLSLIAAHLLAAADPDPDAGRAAEAILVLANRNASVDAIANALGWSQRSLHRFSIDTFGIPAFVLRSLCRFRTAHELLSSGIRPVDVAMLAGYADQAHLTRNIKRFASTTPGEVGWAQAGTTPSMSS